MKQLLQNLKNGKASVEEVPIPTPWAGMALVKTEASLVSAGTERMVVEFAEKSLVGKARSRPDLVYQVLEKARREGCSNNCPGCLQPAGPAYGAWLFFGGHDRCPGRRYGLGSRSVNVWLARVAAMPCMLSMLLCPATCSCPCLIQSILNAAAFTTLGAIAMHGFRLAEPQIGESVAVIGLGLLGLLTGQIAAAAGCRVLGIDTDPKRVALASSLGLQAWQRGQSEEWAMAFTANRGFDMVIICADTPSTDPVEFAGTIARDRGRVVATGAVGLTLPRKVYYEKELSFINSRSYGPGRYDPSYEEYGRDYPIGYVRWTEGRNLESVVELLGSGKIQIEPLITHRIPIEKAAEAYEVITGKKKEPFLGVLLTYPGGIDEPISRISRRVRLDKRKTAAGIAKNTRVELGVLGAGLFANATLLPILRKSKRIKLVGIASSSGLHAKHAGKKFKFSYATSSDDEIINDQNVNTVAILTRHDSHADLVLKALQAGKHVFVEKPLAINTDQLSAISEQLLKIEENLLTVGFNRRFAPLAKQLSAFLSDRSEPLHAHYRINAGYIPLKHWT